MASIHKGSVRSLDIFYMVSQALSHIRSKIGGLIGKIQSCGCACCLGGYGEGYKLIKFRVCLVACN